MMEEAEAFSARLHEFERSAREYSHRISGVLQMPYTNYVSSQCCALYTTATCVPLHAHVATWPYDHAWYSPD